MSPTTSLTVWTVFVAPTLSHTDFKPLSGRAELKFIVYFIVHYIYINSWPWHSTAHYQDTWFEPDFSLNSWSLNMITLQYYSHLMQTLRTNVATVNKKKWWMWLVSTWTDPTVLLIFETRRKTNHDEYLFILWIVLYLPNIFIVSTFSLQERKVV